MSKGDRIAWMVVGVGAIAISTAIAVPASITTEGERIADKQEAVRKQHRPQRMQAAIDAYINKLSFTPVRHQIRCYHSSATDDESDYDYICKARNQKTRRVIPGKFGLVVTNDGADPIDVERFDND